MTSSLDFQNFVELWSKPLQNYFVGGTLINPIFGELWSKLLHNYFVAGT